MAALSRRAALAGGAAIALTGPVCARFAAAQPVAPAQFFRIATGPTESSYFEAGTLIGNLISSPPGSRDCARGGSCGVPGLIAVTQTTQGSLANIDLIAGKKLESGLCQADIAYWAFHGTGLYAKKGAVRNLRAIANLFPETMHAVVRDESGIRDLKQLKGRNVSLGERDSATLVNARTVLQAVGIGEREVKAQFLKPGQAADALIEGRIDAFFDTAAVPSAVVRDLASHVEIALLPIAGPMLRKLRQTYPFFTERSIPANAYRGVEATPSLGIGVLWIVDEAVDEKIVQGLTRALFHPNNRKALDAAEPLGRNIKLETALDGVALQLHPGAAHYYFEVGAIR
jgi:uncharacterized protein